MVDNVPVQHPKVANVQLYMKKSDHETIKSLPDVRKYEEAWAKTLSNFIEEVYHSNIFERYKCNGKILEQCAKQRITQSTVLHLLAETYDKADFVQLSALMGSLSFELGKNNDIPWEGPHQLTAKILETSIQSHRVVFIPFGKYQIPFVTKLYRNFKCVSNDPKEIFNQFIKFVDEKEREDIKNIVCIHADVVEINKHVGKFRKAITPKDGSMPEFNFGPCCKRRNDSSISTPSKKRSRRDSSSSDSSDSSDSCDSVDEDKLTPPTIPPVKHVEKLKKVPQHKSPKPYKPPTSKEFIISKKKVSTNKLPKPGSLDNKLGEKISKDIQNMSNEEPTYTPTPIQDCGFIQNIKNFDRTPAFYNIKIKEKGSYFDKLDHDSSIDRNLLLSKNTEIHIINDRLVYSNGEVIMKKGLLMVSPEILTIFRSLGYVVDGENNENFFNNLDSRLYEKGFDEALIKYWGKYNISFLKQVFTDKNIPAIAMNLDIHSTWRATVKLYVEHRHKELLNMVDKSSISKVLQDKAKSKLERLAYTLRSSAVAIEDVHVTSIRNVNDALSLYQRLSTNKQIICKN